ncbi:cytidine deaminase [Ferruginibacter sp. SUN106]|uniref:cytidine deaminase n=1 Tax=Ferruginibacter sp. SUN106 TaxID=2978348 RepID=UPI003D35AB4A
MNQEQYNFSFEVYNSIAELSPEDAKLVTEARKVTANAYAPYSHFNVGAVAQLKNGQTVTGTNQENAAYPVGICAERVLLSAAATLFPGIAIDTLAISYDNKNGKSDHPISPCGICRQTLAEYEERVKQPIRLVLSGQEGKIYIIKKASQLLPLSFGGEDMK